MEAVRTGYKTAIHFEVRVRLFSALAAAGLKAAGSSSQRAAVVRRIVADTLPAVAAVVQAGTRGLPHLSQSEQEAWAGIDQALQVLGQTLDAAEQNEAPLSLRSFDSTAAALAAGHSCLAASGFCSKGG